MTPSVYDGDSALPIPSKARSIAFFLLAVVVLEFVVCLRMPSDWQGEWDRATSLFVTNSVWRKVTQGMSAPLADCHEADRNHDLAWNGAPLDRHYPRHFGAGTFLLAAFAPRDPDRMERYLLSARYVAATLSILVTSGLLTVLMRRSGLPTGLALLAFLALNPAYSAFPAFLRSLHWLPGLGLLPLVIMLAFYGSSASPGRRRLTLTLFGGAIFLRALCGYEYISVPVLASCAAIFYCAPGAGLKVVLRDSVKFVVAGGIGTASAIAVHAISLYWTFGTWEEAYNNTIRNAIRRSYGVHEAGPSVSSAAAQFRAIYGTLAQDKLLTIVIGLWFVAMFVYVVRERRRRRASQPKHDLRLTALAAASLAALAATSSWLLLMRNHTAVHPQYNNVAFYQGFIWFAIPFIVTFAVGMWNDFRSTAAGESPARMHS